MARRRLALLVATYNYQDSDLRQLTAPANDAEALAAVLQDPDISGFEVTTLVIMAIGSPIRLPPPAWSAVAVVAFVLAWYGWYDGAVGIGTDPPTVFSDEGLVGAGGWTLLLADLVLVGSVVGAKKVIREGRGQREE